MAKKKATRRGTKRAKVVRRKATKKVAKRLRAARKSKRVTKAARKKVARKVKRAARAPAKRAATGLRKRVARPRPQLPPQPVAPPVTPPPVVEAEPITPPASQPQGAPQSEFDSPDTSSGPTVDAEAVPLGRAPPMPRLQVGDAAPDFSLPDEMGRTHSLSDYRGRRVVLYFYPRDDSPGCTVEACGFRDRLGEFADCDAVVLGVSPDSVESHRSFALKYGLTFPLLSDDGHQVAERYGVWVEKRRQGTISAGVARTTFLIDPHGRVEHCFQNVRPEGHEREVLARLTAR